jgi:hypothetical protein
MRTYDNTFAVDQTFIAKIIGQAQIRLASYTVGTLPAGTNGDTAFATDTLAPAFAAAATGSGTVKVPVYYDGAWKVG